MKLRAVSLILVATIACLASSARAEGPDSLMIGFDSDTQGHLIEEWTQINETWSSWGIHLSHVAGTEGFICGPGNEVWAVAHCVGSGPMSAPNVVSSCDPGGCPDFSEANFGSIHVDFDRETTLVCIGVMPAGGADRGRLRVFNQAGELLSETLSAAGQRTTICIPGTGIHHAEFTAPGSQFSRFDDLTVRFAPVPVVPTTFSTVKAIYR